MEALADALQRADGDSWSHDGILEIFDAVASTLEIKRAELIHPCRLALTGVTVGPGLFELVEVLGQKETVARLRQVATDLREGSLTLVES